MQWFMMTDNGLKYFTARVINGADMFSEGQLGGRCQLNESLLHSLTRYPSGDFTNDMKSWWATGMRISSELRCSLLGLVNSPDISRKCHLCQSTQATVMK
jgi:hypothetical protein